jgi:site-specific DNA-methyltransferase (adenine-specific)
MQNALYYGDNLAVLRESIADESVDLIYLDPPFNSNANYNVLFKSPKGAESEAQIEAFEDTWHWNIHAEQAFDETIKSGNTEAASLLMAMRSALGENDMMAYLAMMAVRLIELHRTLKPTGSLYLHCDPTASHYLKIIMDSIFSVGNYRSDITWLRSRNPKGSQYESKRYSPDTDNILYYAKTDESELHVDRIQRPLTPDELEIKYDRKDEIGPFTDGPITRSPSMGKREKLSYEYKGFNTSPWGWRMEKPKLIELDKRGNLGWTSNEKPYRKLRPEDDMGMPVGNCWADISLLNPQAAERLGYPTQKPLALLERIISASSNADDLVLDPFCGCGTTVHAAQKLNRRWIGIDITHLAIGLIERRLKDAFPGIKFEVHGTPKDFAGAENLAQRDKYQFQWWAVTLINAVPYGGKKKGADSGIDGYYYCKPDGKKTESGIVSVKGGENLHRDMVSDLRGVMEREKSPLAVLITLREPTAPMVKEAASAGFFKTPFGQFPRIQIATVEQLLEGKTLKLPPQERGGGYKQAAREKVGQEPML